MMAQFKKIAEEFKQVFVASAISNKTGIDYEIVRRLNDEPVKPMSELFKKVRKM
jgi:hypothetical protein